MDKSYTNRLYNSTIPIVGLTGGIATGKSTISRMLTNDGHFVICADDLIKEIYGQKQTIDFIEETVPNAVTAGTINFPILREAFFSKKEIKKKIENFLHQRLPELFKNKLEKTTAAFAIYDIPLLFEKNLESYFDLVALVYAPREVQFERVKQRDQSPDQVIENILSEQLPIEEKKKKAQYIIDNSQDLVALEKEYQNFKTYLQEQFKV